MPTSDENAFFENLERISVNRDTNRLRSDDKITCDPLTRIPIGCRIDNFIVARQVSFGRQASMHLAFSVEKRQFVGIKILHHSKSRHSDVTPDSNFIDSYKPDFFPRLMESFPFPLNPQYRVEVYTPNSIGMSLLDIHEFAQPVILSIQSLLKLAKEMIRITTNLQAMRDMLHVDVYPHNIILPSSNMQLFNCVLTVRRLLPDEDKLVVTHRGECTQHTANQTKRLFANMILQKIPSFLPFYYFTFSQRILHERTKLHFCHQHAHMFSKDRKPIIGYSKHYRAPELFFGAEQSPAIDVWNMGCIIYYLASGKHLFGNGSDEPKAILAEIITTVGPLEAETFKDYPQYSEFFDSEGQCLIEAKPYSVADRLNNINVFDEERSMLVTFIRSLLVVDPSKRPGLDKLFVHPVFNFA